jgi:hypothetical protein
MLTVGWPNEGQADVGKLNQDVDWLADAKVEERCKV